MFLSNLALGPDNSAYHIGLLCRDLEILSRLSIQEAVLPIVGGIISDAHERN